MARRAHGTVSSRRLHGVIVNREFTIVDRAIGGVDRCFIIAEAGVNHNGNLDVAMQLVDVAAQAGADAVKFQTFSADRLALVEAPKAAYQARATDANESQHAMLKRLELSYEQHVALARRCEERGILFLSTPFDEEAADLLERLGVVAYKTPSGELTNLPFLRHIARKRRPMIVSTGMATLGEVEDALIAVEESGCSDVAVLHCVSNYPAAPETINLRAMDTLSRAFGVPAGYSDHTTGIEIALASIARGATVLEKHFTLDRSLPGPDHAASLEPDELVELVRSARAVEAALGTGRKAPGPAERSTAAVARKSLVLARDVRAGEVLDEEAVVAKRPGTGMPLKLLPLVIGKTTRQDLRAGTMLSWEMLA